MQKALRHKRFGPAQTASDNKMITISQAVLTENGADGFGVKAENTLPGYHPL